MTRTFSRAARLLGPLAALLVALSLAPAFAPGAGAQSSAAVTVDDPAGDVMLGAPASGAPAPLSGGLDVKQARLFGESGESFLIQVTLANINEETTYPFLVSQGVHLLACFKWNGAQYGVQVQFRPGQEGILNERDLGAVAGECKPDAPVAFTKAKNIGSAVHLDTGANTITIGVDRVTLAGLTETAPPRKGDTITGLYVLANDGGRNRFDAAPDGGPSDDALTLTFDTANLGDLRAVADSNAGRLSFPCDGRVDFPTYAIQAGGKRGVPVVFSNLGSAEKVVDFSVVAIGGKDWKPRMLPSLEVPPTATTGNTTVNVILDTPAGTAHKDCSIIVVRGVDRASGDTIAEAAVIVTAVSPPSPTSQRLWLHTNQFAGPGVCSGVHTWLNVLQTDPNDKAKNIQMKDCRNPDYLSTATATLTTALDINPNYDLVVNTSASDKTATAVVNYISEVAPTNARVTVIVKTLAGGDAIGEGSADAAIQGTPTAVTVPLRIRFTRDQFAEGDPSLILPSADGLAVSFTYQPLPANPNVPNPKPAGHVSLVSKGTYLELPVADTIKRNANDPGVKGGLLSIRPANELPQFAFPGAIRLFNFTVLNEGADPDAAIPAFTLTGVKNWTGQFYPPGPYALDAGKRATFQLALTANPDAEESETALLDVTVTSQKDETARASVATRVVATREFGVPQEAAPVAEVVKEKGGLLPAPPALAVLALVGALGAALRRRP